MSNRNCSLSNFWDLFTPVNCYERKKPNVWKLYLENCIDSDDDSDDSNHSVIINQDIDNWNPNIELAEKSINIE